MPWLLNHVLDLDRELKDLDYETKNWVVEKIFQHPLLNPNMLKYKYDLKVIKQTDFIVQKLKVGMTTHLALVVGSNSTVVARHLVCDWKVFNQILLRVGMPML